MDTSYVCVSKKELKFDSILHFGGHLGRHLGKYATAVIDFYIYSYSTSFTSYEWTLYLSLYLKGALRYIRFRISAAILAAILENMQLLLLISTYSYSTSFTSYELTIHMYVYLKRELIFDSILHFGGHLGRHLGKYATAVIDFYIFILYVLHFI